MTPYKAVSLVDAFDFDADAGRKLALYQEPQTQKEFSGRLNYLHELLLGNGANARIIAAKEYNKVEQELDFKFGGRVMVYN